jgi:hypothetical protein
MMVSVLRASHAVVATVGYGDVYPVTAAGRGVALFASSVGVLLMGGLTGAFMGLISLAPFELRMIEFVELNEYKATLKDRAARVIQLCWRQYKVRTASANQPLFRSCARSAQMSYVVQSCAEDLMPFLV